jgi:hypothetical protein
MELQPRRHRSSGSLLLVLVAVVLLVCGVAMTAQRGGHPDATLYSFILAAFAALRASRVAQELAMIEQLLQQGGAFSDRWLASHRGSLTRRLSTWAVAPLVVLLLVLIHGRWMPSWFWVVSGIYLLLESCIGLTLERRYHRWQAPPTDHE